MIAKLSIVVNEILPIAPNLLLSGVCFVSGRYRKRIKRVNLKDLLAIVFHIRDDSPAILGPA